jgi:hypothetical protein
MKKTGTFKPDKKEPDDMLPEYEFDYTKSRPNRFAKQKHKVDLTITLDPDVAEVFKDSESVNAVLRALIENMPRTNEGKKADNELPV